MSPWGPSSKAFSLYLRGVCQNARLTMATPTAGVCTSPHTQPHVQHYVLFSRQRSDGFSLQNLSPVKPESQFWGMRMALRFAVVSFKRPWGAQILQEWSLQKKGVLPVRMCHHKSGGNWQISLEEKGQTRCGIRLRFYMTFCGQTWARFESSGPMQMLGLRLALGKAKGIHACVWKRLCRCHQSWLWPKGSEGCPVLNRSCRYPPRSPMMTGLTGFTKSNKIIEVL